MRDIERIESINADQLATPTDWLLMGCPRKRRPARRSSPSLVYDERTVIVAKPVKGLRSRHAAAAVLATTAGLAITMLCFLA